MQFLIQNKYMMYVIGWLMLCSAIQSTGKKFVTMVCIDENKNI